MTRTEARIRTTGRSSKEQRRANGLVARAVSTGALERPEVCSRCGQRCERIGGLGDELVNGIQAHHSDYSRPLDVSWLCASCHRREHMGRGRET